VCVLAILLAVLPGRLHRWVRVRLGADIHPTVRIGFGVLIAADSLTIGRNVRIRSLVRINVSQAHLDRDVVIGPMVSITAHSLEIADHASIAQATIVAGDRNQVRSRLVVGSHSRIFPFSWIDPGHGVTLGSRVGIGGHGLIFTHGSWSNYFRGAPVASGPVVIEDGVWLPWRVFVMPNVTIGRDAIIGAGSIVTRSVPPRALAAGMPATVLREEAYRDLSQDELALRISSVLDEYFTENPTEERIGVVSAYDADGARRSPVAVVVGAGPFGPQFEGASQIDVVGETLTRGRGAERAVRLADWLSRYGVRVDEVES